MHTFAQKPKATQQAESAETTLSTRTHFAHTVEVNKILEPQRTIGNQGLQRPLPAHTKAIEGDSTAIGLARIGRDFSRIPTHANASTNSLPKLRVNAPGDKHEQEADRVAAQVMNTTRPIDIGLQRQGDHAAQAEIKTKPLAESISPVAQAQFDRQSHLNVSEGGGSPLPAEIRSFMEPRFGTDLSKVRVHTGSDAVEMNRELNAFAFTHGRDIYFGAGQSPGKDQLTAHELAHVVQHNGLPGFISRQPKPATPVNWRDQARNKVPFNKWTTAQKEEADRDWHASSRRIFTAGDKEKLEFHDNDNEVFRLLNPYHDDLKDFYERHTHMLLESSLNPSKQGQSVTFTAIVSLPTGATPTGTVTFNANFAGGSMLQELGKVPLKGGKATLTISALPKSTKWVTATYPDTGNLFGSQTEISQSVT